MAVVSNKRSVMTLFSDPQSAYSHRVRVVLAEKNIMVDIVDVDPLNLPDDIMDFNPYGSLPTLVDRDLKLYESRIIMEYLDERFPHPPLLPVDPVSRANTRLYLYRVERDWYRLMDRIQGDSDEDAGVARKELTESLIATAPVLDAKPYFMNEEPSLVDCAIAPLLWRLPSLGIELPSVAKPVRTYAMRLFERDSFRQSLSEYEEEMFS